MMLGVEKAMSDCSPECPVRGDHMTRVMMERCESCSNNPWVQLEMLRRDNAYLEAQLDLLAEATGHEVRRVRCA
jgi:hypothetical protein